MWEILVPGPGIKPGSRALEGKFLTTGTPGTSLPEFLRLKKIPFFLDFLFSQWRVVTASYNKLIPNLGLQSFSRV